MHNVIYIFKKYLSVSFLNCILSLKPSTLLKIITFKDICEEVCLRFGESQFKEYLKLSASKTSPQSIYKCIFYVQTYFFCRMNICLKQLYFYLQHMEVCIKIYLPKKIYIFYIYFKLFMLKKFLFSKKSFFCITIFWVKKILCK